MMFETQARELWLPKLPMLLSEKRERLEIFELSNFVMNQPVKA